jgi:hypothetical protein
MVTTLTFKGFLKDVKAKYARHRGVVGIMLIKATKGNSDNNELVVNYYEEWDSLTSYAKQPMYVFWAGYGCWLSPSDENQRRIILDAYDNRENRRIYFDNQKYGMFKRELRAFWNDPEIEWGSAANLLLINCAYGELDFQSGTMISLDDYERFGYHTRAGFCEDILRKWHNCDSVATLLLQLRKQYMEKPVVLPQDGSKGQTQSVTNNYFLGSISGSNISTGNNAEQELEITQPEEKSWMEKYGIQIVVALIGVAGAIIAAIIGLG